MNIGREPIDLKLSLMDSAQCFAWTQCGEKYGAILRGEPVWLWVKEDEIVADGGDAAFLRTYLDLDRNYSALAQEYAKIDVARRAVELYPGLRVLNQDPWETLVSFILSANNNVLRIRRLWSALAAHCGKMVETCEGTLCGLPSADQLARCSEEELRRLGVGYRAPYLVKTAQRIVDGFPLDALCEMDYDQAHAKLIELPGVGDKVADCVLLFGCRHASAFPVDTWVEKLLRDWFGIEAKGRRQMLTVSRALLGEHAGLLQQFLFHAARTGGIPIN